MEPQLLCQLLGDQQARRQQADPVVALIRSVVEETWPGHDGRHHAAAERRLKQQFDERPPTPSCQECAATECKVLRKEPAAQAANGTSLTVLREWFKRLAWAIDAIDRLAEAGNNGLEPELVCLMAKEPAVRHLAAELIQRILSRIVRNVCRHNPAHFDDVMQAVSMKWMDHQPPGCEECTAEQCRLRGGLLQRQGATKTSAVSLLGWFKTVAANKLTDVKRRENRWQEGAPIARGKKPGQAAAAPTPQGSGQGVGGVPDPKPGQEERKPQGRGVPRDETSTAVPRQEPVPTPDDLPGPDDPEKRLVTAEEERRREAILEAMLEPLIPNPTHRRVLVGFLKDLPAAEIASGTSTLALNRAYQYKRRALLALGERLRRVIARENPGGLEVFDLTMEGLLPAGVAERTGRMAVAAAAAKAAALAAVAAAGQASVAVNAAAVAAAGAAAIEEARRWQWGNRARIAQCRKQVIPLPEEATKRTKLIAEQTGVTVVVVALSEADLSPEEMAERTGLAAFSDAVATKAAATATRALARARAEAPADAVAAAWAAATDAAARAAMTDVHEVRCKNVRAVAKYLEELTSRGVGG